MERSDVLQIMAILRGAYPQFYRDVSRREAEDTVNLWHDMFRHDDPKLVGAAVKSLIAGDEKGYPPSIGQVRSKMRLLTSQNELSEGEAWQLVARAISNGIYGSKKEFEALPQTIQRIVGSPNALREWAMMDSDVVHSVVASNFQRSYRVVSEREREIKALPQDVRELVNLLAASKTLEITEVAYEIYHTREAGGEKEQHADHPAGWTSCFDPERRIQGV